MIDGIMNRFNEQHKLNEDYALLAEMGEVDSAMDEVDDEVLSPEEIRKIEKELKKIPEDLEKPEKITKSDEKQAEKEADPTVSELVESIMGGRF